MDTGVFSEFSSDIYSPLDMEDRIILLKRLLWDYKNHQLKILKKNIGNLDNELFLYVTQTSGYLAIKRRSINQPVYLDIGEPGLNFAFWDFCESLNDNLFLEENDVEKELKNLIQLYSQQINKNKQ